MTDDQYDAQENALFMKGQAEWIKTRIADTCEDYGSTDGTPAGIADAEQRTACETVIKRAQRDHARYLREHYARQAIERARQNAHDHEERMRERFESRERPDNDDEGRPNPFSTALPARQIMEKFNRKTGKRR